MNAVVRRAARWALVVLVTSAALAVVPWVLYLAYVIDADRLMAGIRFALAVLGGGLTGVLLHSVGSLYLLGAERRSAATEDRGAPGCPAADTLLAHLGAPHPQRDLAISTPSLRADLCPRIEVTPSALSRDTAAAAEGVSKLPADAGGSS